MGHGIPNSSLNSTTMSAFKFWVRFICVTCVQNKKVFCLYDLRKKDTKFAELPGAFIWHFGSNNEIPFVAQAHIECMLRKVKFGRNITIV